MAPLDGKAPPADEFCHYGMIPKSGRRFSEKIMHNNRLKRNGSSTPFRFSIMIAAKRRAGQSRGRPRNPAAKIMTGELAPARHVPCAATRCREPGSNPPFDATLVANGHIQANLTLAIVTFGRTKRDRSGSEHSSVPESLKEKYACASAVRVWG